MLRKTTWDAMRKGTGVSLSADNRTATVPNQLNSVIGTVGYRNGKRYFEVVDTIGDDRMIVGISNVYVPLNAQAYTDLNMRGYFGYGAVKEPEATSYGVYFGKDDVIGVAVDMDKGTLTFFKNGVSQGISHTNIKALGRVFPFVTSGGGSAGPIATLRTSRTQFSYPLPGGYKPWEESDLTTRIDRKSLLVLPVAKGGGF